MDVIDFTISTDKEIVSDIVKSYNGTPQIRISIDDLEVDEVLKNFEIEDIIEHYGKDKLLAEINKPEEE